MSTDEKVDVENSKLSPSTKNKLDESNDEQILCYICGGNGANWSMFTKAIENTPYFPFLESLEQAEGAQAVKANGRIDACTVCFSFLLQQWHSYEDNETPVEKRTYWLKRSGGGAIEFNYSHSGHDFEHCSREFEEQEIVKHYNEIGEDEQTRIECGYDEEEKLDKELQPNVEMQDTAMSRTGEHEQQMDTVQTCLVCGCQKVKDVMRIVHTKPQLKTETPFYPFLLHHKPEVKKTSGKVAVCQVCQLFLLHQWQDFQKKGTNLSQRHYHLPSSSPPTQKKPSLPTICCFVCGEEYCETSRWDISSKKGIPGEPYFPFLSSHSPGAASHTEDGLVRVCAPCYKSLLCQWEDFERKGVNENERKYSIENRLVKTSKSQRSPESKSPESKSPESKSPCLDTTCSVCKMSYPAYKIEYIKQPLNRNHVLSIDQQRERIPVCCHCKKVQRDDETVIETQPGIQSHCNERPILNSRDCVLRIKNKDIADICKEDVEICFLCGEKMKQSNSGCLHVLPQHDTNGYKPFFPSLAYMVPAYHARPPAPSGSVTVCSYCHGNMMNQWLEFEKQTKNGICNPWSRQYATKQFACYLCGKIYSRQKITSISAGDYPFLNQLKRPTQAFRVNGNHVVCRHCKDIVTVQKDNFDKCGVDNHEREFELPMIKIRCPSEPLKNRPSGSPFSSHHTVVVIGDSDSEGETKEQASRLEQPGNISHDFNLSKLLTGSKSSQAKESLHMSSPSGENSSFAAALRKLAKQAMSPGSHSPVSIPPSSNLSPVKNKVGCESPKLNGGLNNFKKEVPDPSYLSSKENHGQLNMPSTSDHVAMTTNMGHQVVPGVYSVGSRGYENKSHPLEELHGQSHMQDVPRLRAVHPQPPFYMPFLQRPVMQGDSMYMPPMPPFHYYPPPGPPMVEPPPGLLPPGFDHEAWRKRRAMEHLRQQHERHTHYFTPHDFTPHDFTPHDRPLYIMEQEKALTNQTSLPPRSFASDLAQSRENNLGKISPRHDTDLIRATNCSMAKESDKNIEVVCSRASTASDHGGAVACPHRGHSPAGVVTSVISPVPLHSPPKDSVPGEREEVEGGKDVKQREHQIMWTRKMFEQKRRLRQEEIEWQHRQQQMRQQKREVQQELYQFRQKLLQQKEMDDSSTKEHGKLPEKEDPENNRLLSNERLKEKTVEAINADKITFPPFNYPLYHDQPPTMHIANMYRPPVLQQHEIFYPPGYPTQAPLPPRMDTRMYRDYLQQPSHLPDNKVVSDWLEKQRQTEFIQKSCPSETERKSAERSGLSSLVLNGKLDGEKCSSHEPQKLKFMKDLGLMTVSDKKERVQTVFGKRKFSEDMNSLQDEIESDKENRVENGITDTTKSSTKGSNVEQENENESYCKKVAFLYNLGLVTHRKRQELEDDFEKSRWDRKTQRLQKRTKRTKKEKKEDKERNRSKTPLDLGVSGPITRQKQQLLQEYGLLLPIKDGLDKESPSSSPDSATTSDVKEKGGNQGQAKKTKTNQDESSIKSEGEKNFHNTYNVSTPPAQRPSSKTNGPQLTLQSITHMENPYTSFPSAFRPPFYHSGLLSVRPETSTKPGQTNLGHEPLNRGNNFMPVAPTSMYEGQNSGMQPTWLPTEGTYQWPGIKKIIQSYSVFHQEQENELNFSKEKSKKLKVENSSLSDERSRLNSTYSGLIHAKRKTEEEQHSITGKLEKMHNFVVFVQNS